MQVHMYWQIAATLAVAGGLAVIEANKVGWAAGAAAQVSSSRVLSARLLAQILHGKPHFGSLHAKLGFAASVLTLLVAAGGLASFRKLGILQRLPEALQGPIKAVHRNVQPSGIALASRRPPGADVLTPPCRLAWPCGCWGCWQRSSCWTTTP